MYKRSQKIEVEVKINKKTEINTTKYEGQKRRRLEEQVRVL